MIRRTKMDRFHLFCPARRAKHPFSELRDGLCMKPAIFHATGFGFAVICKEIGQPPMKRVSRTIKTVIPRYNFSSPWNSLG